MGVLGAAVRRPCHAALGITPNDLLITLNEEHFFVVRCTGAAFLLSRLEIAYDAVSYKPSAENIAVDPFSQALEKYGPMGCALVVVCLVLWWFITKLFPALMETHGKRLDNLAQAITKSKDEHEENAVKRHGEVVTGIGEIKEGIHEIRDRLPEAKKDEGGT